MTVAFDPDAPAVTPRDAATVILLRDAADGSGLEVFFVKRDAAARFMGGAYVFPGGKLDAADADARVPSDLDEPTAAARLCEPDGSRSRALHVAAARECLEESGVLFAQNAVDPADVAALRHAVDVEHRALHELLPARGITLRLTALVPFARWITPRVETRRFDARFFLAAAPAGVLASHDERENVASDWLSPREALARAAREEIVLVPPTYRTVELLAQQPDTRTALAMVPAAVPVMEPVVVFEPETNGVIVALPGDPLHPEPLPAPARPGAVDTSVLATRFVYRDGVWTAARPG